MVAIGYRLSIMNLVTSFLCDILLADGVQEIQGICGVAKAGDLNHQLIVI